MKKKITNYEEPYLEVIPTENRHSLLVTLSLILSEEEYFLEDLEDMGEL